MYHRVVRNGTGRHPGKDMSGRHIYRPSVCPSVAGALGRRALSEYAIHSLDRRVTGLRGIDDRFSLCGFLVDYDPGLLRACRGKQYISSHYPLR